MGKSLVMNMGRASSSNRLLFGVCGIGYGHASRSYCVLKELEFETKVVTFGSGYAFFREMGIEAIKLEGIKWIGRKFSFDVFATLARNIAFPEFLADYAKVSKSMGRFNPSLVLSDCEPCSIFFAWRKKIPCFCITHFPLTVQHYQALGKLKNEQLRIQWTMLREALRAMRGISETVFVPALWKGRGEKKEKYTNPIAFTEVKEKKGDFYLVSCGGSEIGKKFLSFLRPLLGTREKFVIVGWKRRERMKNLLLLPLLPFTSYLSYLKGSKGLIATAGYSTISEALAFGKPMLLFPIENHIEQLVNAKLAAEAGYALTLFPPYRREEVEEKIRQFLRENEALRAASEEARLSLKFDGAKQIAMELERASSSTLL